MLEWSNSEFKTRNLENFIKYEFYNIVMLSNSQYKKDKVTARVTNNSKAVLVRRPPINNIWPIA